jgi:hypothetical protein
MVPKIPRTDELGNEIFINIDVQRAYEERKDSLDSDECVELSEQL